MFNCQEKLLKFSYNFPSTSQHLNNCQKQIFMIHVFMLIATTVFNSNMFFIVCWVTMTQFAKSVFINRSGEFLKIITSVHHHKSNTIVQSPQIYILQMLTTIVEVAWPSGLRRWFKAPVSSEAWPVNKSFSYLMVVLGVVGVTGAAAAAAGECAAAVVVVVITKGDSGVGCCCCSSLVCVVGVNDISVDNAFVVANSAAAVGVEYKTSEASIMDYILFGNFLLLLLLAD
ncbi:hypothetical protein FF38_02182 [Lucilia cuprina]|uniref:Transmembrane protein n=1 Tax=Lucilia cuprina TaxID=7375 RepID=A0A0L0BVY8_LUCCU|nr:hypothetical protein FF38_02182 [Lucilia cuprina]